MDSPAHAQSASRFSSSENNPNHIRHPGCVASTSYKQIYLPLCEQSRSEQCEGSPERRRIANRVPRFIWAMTWVVDDLIYSKLNNLPSAVIFAERSYTHAALPP